jgi:hypothetical protein
VLVTNQESLIEADTFTHDHGEHMVDRQRAALGAQQNEMEDKPRPIGRGFFILSQLFRIQAAVGEMMSRIVL